MRFLILSVILMELLLSGVYSVDVLVESRAKKLVCKNPKGKLGEASFFNCGQAVCKRSGKVADWDVCPEKAKQETLEEIQTSVNETENNVKKVRQQVDVIEMKVNETERTVKETERTVKETERTVKETERTVKETERTVKETERTVKETERTVKETERTVKETEENIKEIKETVNALLLLALSNGNLPVVFYKPQEFNITRNNLLTSLPYLGQEWILSFHVLLTDVTESNYKSIIHVGLGGDVDVYGDRNPEVFFWSTGFIIASSISGNKNEYKNIYPPIQAGKWIKFEISQLLIDNKYIFEVKIDDKSYWVVENNDARVFENIKVFAGDNFYDPAPGKIRNLKIQTNIL